MFITVSIFLQVQPLLTPREQQQIDGRYSHTRSVAAAYYERYSQQAKE